MLLEVEQISTFNQIFEICRLKEPYEELWTTAAHFITCYEQWMNGPLLQVNAEEVEEEVCYNFVLEPLMHSVYLCDWGTSYTLCLFW